jgi:hypothetical protein
MFRKTTRPSSTALVMLAKLSSARTMSEASRATSVPGLAHGHAQVRCLQGRSIVDPVPGDRHDVPLGLEPLTSNSLWSGETRA